MIDLFLVGSARSGTTMLASMLRERYDIAIGPETHLASMITRRRLPPTRLTTDDPARLARTLRALPEFDGVPFDVGVFAAHHQPGFAGALVALLRATTSDDAAACIGEKTPGHLSYWSTLSHVFPEAKFLCLTRDPRAVAASRAATGWAGGRAPTVATHWVLDQRTIDAAQQALGPNRLRRVSYETLLRSPATEWQDLDAWLALARRTAPAPDGHLANRSEVWKATTSATPDEARIEGWTLDKRDLTAVEAICWRRMSELGYEPRHATRPRFRPSWADARELVGLMRSRIDHARHCRLLRRSAVTPARGR